VLAEALWQTAAWRAGGLDLAVAVNLSASTVVDAELPTLVAGMLAHRQVPADRLILQITEDFLMTDRVRAREVLDAIRVTGVRISVDDFGTGYSSLAYLRDLPVDELKLDRSFITPMNNDARAAALVSSSVALAHSLGLQLVAEGVEDEPSWAQLRRYGCDLAQGYVLTRPLPAAQLEQWLHARELGAA
jgi:EAL domain-containing protein (putative c-di-GMP-specific phosphodiesterase class I)